NAVAHKAELGVAGDLAAGHTAAGDGADARNLVDLAYLRLAKGHFAHLRGKHALHRVGDIVDRIIDNAVHPHLNASLFGLGLGDGVGADVEADDDRVRSVGQADVGFRDCADAGVDNPHPDFVVRNLFQALLDC